jgi:hypothetical protein
MNAERARVFVLPVVVALLSACSGITAYHSDLEKNLRIEAKTGSGSIFHKLDIGVHVYNVDAKCQLAYQGTIRLDDSPADVGVPVNMQIYLEFYFAESAMFSDPSSVIKYGIYLRPLPAQEYDAEVSYVDDLYNVRLWEKQRGSTSNRAVERWPQDDCIPALE